MNLIGRGCKRGIWDETIPGITFDDKGVSNYAKMIDRLYELYPKGEDGQKKWTILIDKIKKEGKNKNYDCIIGVSGGTDSSYLLYLAKIVYGLRPLAVNLDNGWNSKTAVENIKRITKALEIDLETYVIDYEEVKCVLRAYIKSGLAWIDGPTDNAIDSVLYKIASREGVKYIFNGSDFRSEGKQPSEWTYTDARQMLSIVKRFNGIKLKSFPYQTLSKLFFMTIIRRIKTYRPFLYVDYSKKQAQEFLEKNYGWQYYGGHHHENVFTKFAISYWMPKKFNIDKRKITLSAQVLSGEISREKAIEMINLPPYDVEDMERDKEYVIKKLDLSNEQFQEYFHATNKTFYDYPSYMPLIEKYLKRIIRFSSYVFPFLPSTLVERVNRQS